MSCLTRAGLKIRSRCLRKGKPMVSQWEQYPPDPMSIASSYSATDSPYAITWEPEPSYFREKLRNSCFDPFAPDFGVTMYASLRSYLELTFGPMPPFEGGKKIQ